MHQDMEVRQQPCTPDHQLVWAPLQKQKILEFDALEQGLANASAMVLV